jgi:hypothetical protein
MPVLDLGGAMGISKTRKVKTMQKIATKLFIGMAVTAIGMYAADSSLGTWKYNAAKSKTTSSNPIKSQTDVREATPDGGVRNTRTGQLTDGTSLNGSYTVSVKPTHLVTRAIRC